MQVPFIDLRSPHRAFRDQFNEAIQGVFDRSDFALGHDVVQFEQEFAEYCGTRFAVGLASGLSALELGLRAFDIGPGDEVILPAHTFVATAAAVTFCGATPVLVDVDPVTYNIDVNQIEDAITERTRAIIPVHLYGLPADMQAINELARLYDLRVIEDACQSHGAYHKKRRTGTWGDAGAFSFYPTKNLGACGDAGMLVTDNEQVANAARAMRNCGQHTKGSHELAPFNYRLDTMQAAILRIKLRHLDEWNANRRRAAARYNEMLREGDVTLPTEADDSTHVYHLYVIRTPRRDALRAHLNEHGVGSAIHYPLPIHCQPFYTRNGLRHGTLHESERLVNEILSLPMFPEITDEQVDYVATNVLSFAPMLQQ
jgi:dTDP-4-amino-4,6-dideoxygalactose transaminase